MTPIYSSPKLLEFYKWWRDTNATITHHEGLCVVLQVWSKDEGYEGSKQLCREMRSQFAQARLDDVFPFNIWHSSSYQRDTMLSAMRQNPNRIAWVKARIEDGTKK